MRRFTSSHLSSVMCHISRVTLFFLFFFVVKLVGGGSVVNGAYHMYFFSFVKFTNKEVKVTA